MTYPPGRITGADGPPDAPSAPEHGGDPVGNMLPPAVTITSSRWSNLPAAANSFDQRAHRGEETIDLGEVGALVVDDALVALDTDQAQPAECGDPLGDGDGVGDGPAPGAPTEHAQLDEHVDRSTCRPAV